MNTKSRNLYPGPSPLRDWLREQEDLEIKDIAEELGLSLSGTYKLYNGESVPSLETAIAIEDLTDGAVSCRDWIP